MSNALADKLASEERADESALIRGILDAENNIEAIMGRFIEKVSGANLRNDLTGYTGWQLHTGASSHTVTALGYPCTTPGMTGTHDLYQQAGKDPGADDYNSQKPSNSFLGLALVVSGTAFPAVAMMGAGIV